MNDVQLIQLLQDKTPEELSIDEIELLRARLAESDDLRQQLFQQLEMEEYLAAALGRVNVSVDAITVTRAPASGQGPHPLLLAVVLLVCVGIVGFASLLIVPQWWQQPQDVAEVNDGDDPPAQADGETPADGEEPIEEPPAKVNADGLPEVGTDPPSTDPPKEVVPPEEVEPPQDPPKPQGPWVAGLESPPQAFAETWFVDFDTAKRIPDKEELEQWFESVPGQKVRFYDEKINNANHGTFQGLMKLKAPFPEDCALRFSTAKADQLRLHCYRGEQGVSIYWNTRHGAADRWAAYTTTREAGQPTPASFHMTDTDEGRDEVCDARYGPTLMLYWHQGNLVLMRGDVELARAGFPNGPPEEIYFEVESSLRGLEMLRLSDHPAPPDDWPPPYEVVERPADMDWQGELPEGTQLEKHEDGSLRLAMDNSEQFGWVAAPLPTDRVRFVEIELEGVRPGAHIWLGPPAVVDGQGKVQQLPGRPNNPTLMFATNDRDRRLAIDWKPRDEGRKSVSYHEIQEKPVPYVGEHTWVRFLVAAGWVRCWVSSDGEEWALWNWGDSWYGGSMTHLGIGCAKGAPGAELTVRTIRYRELPAINGLVDAEVFSKAIGFPEETTYDRWLVAVTQSQPADVDADAWRTACAIRTLATGCPSKTMQALLDSLLRSNRATTTDPKQRLALLGEMPLLASLWEKLPDDQPMDLAKRYAEIGRDLAAADEQRPFSTIRHEMMTQLPMARHFFKSFDPDLIRVELLHLAYQGRWDELATFIEQLKFYGGSQLDQTVPLAPWLEVLVARRQPARLGEGVVRLPGDWQNPLVESYSKEAYNVMADFRATVESESYDDAAQMIAELDPYAMVGLVPSMNDADLLVSVSTAVRSAMNRNRQLADIVSTTFAPLGKLRVRQATTAGDEDAVRLAAVQFHGTEAAGMAHRWLGDRALSSGEFVSALAEYRRACDTVSLLEKRQIEPRMRLAAAMMGLEFGEPVAIPVQFGELQMSGEEFEKLVAEMRTQYANTSAAPESISGESPMPAPAPSGFQVQRRGRLDGEAGEGSNNLDGRVRQYEVPWLERQLGITVDRTVAYVNNRFHVAAYDLAADGKRLWQSPPPPNRGQTHDWKLTAMRPIVTDRYVIARQVAKEGPLLICLNRENGQHVWVAQSQREEKVISDPVLARGRLYALLLREASRGEDRLQLVSFDLDSGERIATTDLLGMRDSWSQRQICSTTALPDGILANLGGFVINVDFDGNVRWARRQLVTPASQEPMWVTQRFDRPLVVGGRAIIASPGVRAIECLDVDFGDLQWRTVLPYVDRLVGVWQSHIIVHAGDEFLALEIATGKQVWATQVLSPFDAELCGGEHGLLISRKIKSPQDNNRNCPELVWLDGATGKITASTTLPDLSEERPQSGPLWRHNDRLWTFFANRVEEPNRDLVELIPQGEAERPQEALATAENDVWLSHTREDLRTAVAEQFPQWRLLSAAGRDGFGYIADIHNEKDVVALPADGNATVVLGREVAIPKTGKPRLKLRFGNDPGQNWRLTVRHGDTILHEADVDWSKQPEIWKDQTVDLKPAAGKSGWLTIEARFLSSGDHTRTYWKRISIEF